MDRNFKLTDLFFCFDKLTNKVPVSRNFGQKPVRLPVERDKPFAVLKKLVIPKQTDDRVWVNFTGSFDNIYMFINGISVFPDKNGLYEITPYIKRGRPAVTAIVKCGRIDGLCVTVKRNKITD